MRQTARNTYRNNIAKLILDSYANMQCLSGYNFTSFYMMSTDLDFDFRQLLSYWKCIWLIQLYWGTDISNKDNYSPCCVYVAHDDVVREAQNPSWIGNIKCNKGLKFKKKITAVIRVSYICQQALVPLEYVSRSGFYPIFTIS